MNEWICENCGRKEDREDSIVSVECFSCSTDMKRAKNGKIIPDGFHACDVGEWPFSPDAKKTPLKYHDKG